VSIDFKKGKGPDEGMISQLKSFSFYQGCMTELLGTYLLVLFALGFGLNADPADSSNDFTCSLATGFLVASIVWFFPACHVNPAVSVAFLVAGEANLVKVLFYVPVQLVGSSFAVKTLQIMIIEPLVDVNATVAVPTVPQIGLTLLSPRLSLLQGVGLEAAITFVLLLTIFACIDKHRSDLSGSYPLTIGYSVTIGCLFGVS
jgi:glycerol uptake facilitator-like aquaporin